MDTTLRQDAIEILRAGIDRVDPYRMVYNSVSRDGSRIEIRTELDAIDLDLNDFDTVFVIGAGKATAPMARRIEEILDDAMTAGAIAVKPGHTDDLARIEMIEAGHPVPNDGSIAAARRMLEIADATDQRTLVFNLVSGGGSALLTMPYADDSHRLSLEEMQLTTQALLASGATIQEINCVRKHLSAIKGGRLVARLAPARVVSLILSDVVGDDLSSIASGLTAPDHTTFHDVRAIFDRYEIIDAIPSAVVELVARGMEGAVLDTPEADDPVFARVSNVLLGSNAQAVHAAASTARSRGYNTVVLGSQITGEAREVAHVYRGILRDVVRFGATADAEKVAPKPACIIGGGETTVTLRGDGRGGRNQEMALSVLAGMIAAPEELSDALFLSGATDGNDGPTDAAGGIVDSSVVRAAGGMTSEIDESLRNNDSYRLLQRIGALLITGPTNTNVCDIQIILVR